MATSANRPQSAGQAGFGVVAWETGADGDAVPIWCSAKDNPLGLEEHPAAGVERRDLKKVPGGFQLLNLLAPAECRRIIQLSENLGYTGDAPLSLPREIRHNDNLVWVADRVSQDMLWHRMLPLLQPEAERFGGSSPRGINGRLRFYRYNADDFFKFHTDSAWPGSEIVDGQLVHDAHPGWFSQLTLLLFLNDDFSGGATRFLVNGDDPGSPARYYNRTAQVDVRTPAGAALCFPHGNHPLQCVHSGELITAGTKYIIRSDVLFDRPSVQG